MARLQQRVRLVSNPGLRKPLGSVLSHHYLIQKLSVLARTNTRTSTYTVTVLPNVILDVRRCVSLSLPLPPLSLPNLAAAHSQSARITPRSDLQSNNFEVQMGENIISRGLTPDPVAVARLPDASQRLESSVSGDLPLLQTGGGFGGGAAGSRLYALGEGTARVIYLKRHTVTRGAGVV